MKNNFLHELKSILFKALRGEFIKLVLKKLLGTAVMGGFKVWLVKLIAKELYDEVGEPLLNYIVNETVFQTEVIKGKLIIKRLDKAREEGDADSYDSNTDDVFN